MVGIIFLTLGALNAAFALTVETCTQGSADSLYGGWLTLFLYVAGVGALNASPPSRAAFVALLPTAAIALWHSWFAVIFAYGFWVHGASACDAMQGTIKPVHPGDLMDGGEPLLVGLWCALALIFWGGTIAAIRNTNQTR